MICPFKYAGITSVGRLPLYTTMRAPGSIFPQRRDCRPHNYAGNPIHRRVRAQPRIDSAEFFRPRTSLYNRRDDNPQSGAAARHLRPAVPARAVTADHGAPRWDGTGGTSGMPPDGTRLAVPSGDGRVDGVASDLGPGGRARGGMCGSSGFSALTTKNPTKFLGQLERRIHRSRITGIEVFYIDPKTVIGEADLVRKRGDTVPHSDQA